VIRLILVASLCLGFLASGAFAADVSIKGSLNETVEASDNYFLLPTPVGTTLKSLSALNLDFLARTPTTRYLLDTNYSYYKYFGPGAADTSPTSGTPASTTFSIDHKTDMSKYNFATSWQRRDVATTQLTESGNATSRGFLDTYNINGGVTRDLNRTDSILWSASGTKTSYTNSNQTPYDDFATTGAWIHRFNPTTTLTNSVTFDWFDADDPAKTERLFWKIMTGLKSQLSSRLTFNASVGEAFANTYQKNAVQSINPASGTTFQTGATNGAVGDIGLTYQLLKSTKVSLTAAHSIMPTTLGQLQEISTIGFLLTHDINHFSNLSFSTQFANNVLAGVESDLFSTQIGYGYQLTREWRTRLSYTYRYRTGGQGFAQSSTVLFGLTYDFTMLGNPTANGQKEVETERETMRETERLGQAFPNLY